ncbi:ABC transporter permease [Paenibacillus alginolyticus]|uniref:ABC transporter permease subunit n=1 Tax=Paenibacillus alginolyticus TaxID=59839 RepID=A0ABT4GBN3_9BACL|nr:MULTISPECIES: ABC transporter permease subunit [Paenibacillus]MCY9693605.1 ABC transporter permease subunit [Paenibacillus alginolyticus]MEC0146644.1 ABC transporter permease subunit [Paenibacillus alginolyticus]NRF94238.1 sugar ABC transporter permease [Paenibacillus frigoriresistens]
MSIALRMVKKNWQLYLIILPSLVYLIIFKYVPMAGVQIAFKNYMVTKGIWGSDWIGIKHFVDFFHLPIFWRVIKNTSLLSLYSLLIGFPAPIILALALNELRNGIFKRAVQLVTFAPYFISTVIMVSIIMLFLSPQLGFVHLLADKFGFPAENIMSKPEYFKTVYVLSDVWQFTGYASVIYIAALAGVDPHLYEAAKVDGASRFQRMIHIDLPSLMPTAVILLILNAGQIMNVGFEKVYLMQNAINVGASEVISTYVYKMGLVGANFSFSAAVGLFNSIVNLLLLIVVNYVARKNSETSLW